MCKGMAKYSDGKPVQSMTMTRASQSVRKRNRQQMCKGVVCGEQQLQDYIAENYPEGLDDDELDFLTGGRGFHRDEFPFAVAEEGGNPDTGICACVPAPENSWQGGMLGDPFKGTKIPVGGKFTIKISGYNCETLQPDATILPRDNEGIVTTTDAESLWLFYDSSDPTKNMIALPLGELNTGRYQVRLNLTVDTQLRMEDFRILTNDGQEIDSTLASNLGEGTITFELDADEQSVGVVGYTEATTGVDVTYAFDNVQGTTSTESSTGQEASATSSDAGVTRMAEPLALVLGAVCFALLQ